MGISPWIHVGSGNGVEIPTPRNGSCRKVWLVVSRDVYLGGVSAGFCVESKKVEIRVLGNLSNIV